MPALYPPVSDPTQDEVFDTTMLCAADYPATGVKWLWPQRIPLGKVTLVAGDPGLGKSLLALDVASRVTNGALWPDEDPATSHRPPGSVLVLSAEDDLADTIRPRLDAAGADPTRVFFLPKITDLRTDLDRLRSAVNRAPECRLIIIDPINAFVGPGDSHFQTVVRRVLQPLAQLAAEKNLAILALSHLRKNDGAAIQRAAGSMGIVSAARSVWTVCRDPEDADRQLFLPLKNNFVAAATGLAYKIQSQPHADGAPALRWDPEKITTPAAELLTRRQKKPGPDALELEAASDWLREQLAEGPRDAALLLVDATLAGVSHRTLRRALHTLGGKTEKSSYHDGWCWSLPGTSSTPPEPNALASGEPPAAAPSDHAKQEPEEQEIPLALGSRLLTHDSPKSAGCHWLGQCPSQKTPCTPKADSSQLQSHARNHTVGSISTSTACKVQAQKNTGQASATQTTQPVVGPASNSPINNQTSNIPTAPTPSWPLRKNQAFFEKRSWPLRELEPPHLALDEPHNGSAAEFATHLMDQIDHYLAQRHSEPPAQT